MELRAFPNQSMIIFSQVFDNLIVWCPRVEFRFFFGFQFFDFSGGETLSCVVIFILIYYFLMAACVWFVMLAYSWFVSFQALGRVFELVER